MGTAVKGLPPVLATVVSLLILLAGLQSIPADLYEVAKIDGAKEQWALETNQATAAACTIGSLFVSGTPDSSYLKSSPTCPGGGTYTVGAIGTAPTCSVGGTGPTGHVLQ